MIPFIIIKHLGLDGGVIIYLGTKANAKAITKDIPMKEEYAQDSEVLDELDLMAKQA